MATVFIGVDPHKLSAIIEVVDKNETVLVTPADTGDVARFADRNRHASWAGTSPIEASSGEVVRYRLSRAGNRRMNP